MHSNFYLLSAAMIAASVVYSVPQAQAVSPAIDPAFHQPATCAGCTDVTLATCSCTASSYYWSSTTFANGSVNAWVVDFNGGNVSSLDEESDFFVRAVRAGL